MRSQDELAGADEMRPPTMATCIHASSRVLLPGPLTRSILGVTDCYPNRSRRIWTWDWTLETAARSSAEDRRELVPAGAV
jgi:hypothetical protein